MAKNEVSTQAKPEQTLTKKVWNMADVLAAAGVGFTDYIIQLTYLLFLKMDSEKESYGLGSSLPEGNKWKDIIELDGPDQLNKYERILDELKSKEGLIGAIFTEAQNKITKPALLKKLIGMIDEETLEKIEAYFDIRYPEKMTPKLIITAITRMLENK